MGHVTANPWNEGDFHPEVVGTQRTRLREAYDRVQERLESLGVPEPPPARRRRRTRARAPESP